MKTFLGVLTLGVVLLFLASSASADVSPSYTLAPDVLASGGQAASSTNYSFVSTLGQPLIGSSSSIAYSACGGYWCEIPADYRVYLPVTLRDY